MNEGLPQIPGVETIFEFFSPFPHLPVLNCLFIV